MKTIYFSSSSIPTSKTISFSPSIKLISSSDIFSLSSLSTASSKLTSSSRRSLSRISLSRGGPKDLLLISTGLLHIKDIYENLVSNFKKSTSPKLLNLILDSLNIDYNLFLNIKKAFKSEVPHTVKEGGFVNDGFSEELDHLRNFILQKNMYIQIFIHFTCSSLVNNILHLKVNIMNEKG